ncbi:MAG: metalloregulator ArsR/SmtB family transcription factor [Bacteroidota bacterium]
MRIRSNIKSKYISENDQEVARIANALAHPLRVALVRYLGEKDEKTGLDNVTCNKELLEMFDYSQSTLSQHVKILKDCGLFTTKAKDKFTYYYLNRELLQKFTDSLNS